MPGPSSIEAAQSHSDLSKAVTRMGDFSYGVYIYAFPIQQAASMLLGPGISALTLFMVSMPATLIVASISWHFVEKPALALKQRFMSTGASA
jgi:peptidoglycan/LPS O-acetylase OafA/YrhL